MLKLVLIAALVGTPSFLARGSSGDTGGCLNEGIWNGNMVLADHVEAIHLNLFVRRADEYFNVGDNRYPLQVGVYGVLQFDKDHTSFPIEKAILACNQLTFEVHTGCNELAKFRLNIVTPGVGGIARGEAEFPDRVRHVDWLLWPCGGTTPNVTRIENPTYTDEARKARVQGEVDLLARFDPSGRVSNVRVVKGLGSGLDKNAIEAVKHWEFKFSGTPSPACEVVLRVQFRLP
ncbi:MAG: energy transducer TonB [Bryobacteraceae bacterium]